MTLKKTMVMDSEPVDPGPRSPLRTLQVLEELTKEPQGFQLHVLAARLDLPKTSVFRLLKTLEYAGYVTFQESVYRLGDAALKLGSALVKYNVFPNCAFHTMRSLSAQCGETIILGTLSDTGNEVIYSEIVDAISPLRFISTVGSAHPLYASVSGLSILAHMPAKRLDHYLETIQLIKLAPKTIASIDELKETLSSIREKGYVISIDGLVEGVLSVGAPIFNATGTVQAGISISAPSSRGSQNIDGLIDLVCNGAKQISSILGYQN